MGSRVQVTDTKTSSTLKFLPHTNHILVFIMNSVTTIVFLCYLISSPTVLSFTIPDQIKSLLGQDVNRQGSLEDNFRQGLFNPEDGIDRTLDIPENIIPVAAIGFVAGLAGQIFGATTATTTTTTTTTTTSTTTTTG